MPSFDSFGTRDNPDFEKMLIATMTHLEKLSPVRYNSFIPEETYIWWRGYKHMNQEDFKRQEAIKRLKAEAARYGLTIEVKQ